MLLELPNDLGLLLFLGLEFLNFALKLKVSLGALSINCRFQAIIVVFARHLLRFKIHVADFLDLREAEVKTNVLSFGYLLNT